MIGTHAGDGHDPVPYWDETIVWTTTDEAAANREGWGILAPSGSGDFHEDDEHNPLEVQALSDTGDGVDPLDGDTAAWRIVAEGVVQGSLLHMRALAVIVASDDTGREAAAIMATLTDGTPPAGPNSPTVTP